MTGDECICERNLPLPIFSTNYCIEYDEIKHQLLSLKHLCGLFWITGVLLQAGLASSCSVFCGFKMLFFKIGLLTPMAFRAIELLLKQGGASVNQDVTRQKYKIWNKLQWKSPKAWEWYKVNLSRPNTTQKSTENRGSSLVPNRKISPRRILIGIKMS